MAQEKELPNVISFVFNDHFLIYERGLRIIKYNYFEIKSHLYLIQLGYFLNNIILFFYNFYNNKGSILYGRMV